MTDDAPATANLEPITGRRGTVYVVATNPFGPPLNGVQDIAGVAMTPDHGGLWAHVSSSMSWLERDLTEPAGRKAELERLYPEGYDVKRVELDDETPEELQKFFTPRTAGEMPAEEAMA